jgi:hypothetical protein
VPTSRRTLPKSPRIIRSYAVISVPFPQAADVALLAQVPTTAVINRAEVEAKAKVTYDGDPQFKPIEQTSLQYATNTPEKVILYGDAYYLCLQGVWFTSAAAQGPWKTADVVPQEIYGIPPSSPVHNVTYVTVANPTTTTVECSHTSGYEGMFLMGTAVGLTVAYGTGYYYPPYYYWGPMYPYPIYRPWPVTYGVGAVWNPYTGGYYVASAYDPMERSGARPGITPPLEDMGEPPQPRLGMEGEQPRQPTTHGRAATALHGRATVPTLSGGDRRLCGATIGCGPDMSQRIAAPWVVFRVLEALPSVLVARVAAR